MNGERPVTTDEDGHFIARFLGGDTSAFDALFVKYQDYVYNIVYGIVGSAEESRDLTQEVFVQVYRSLPGFRRGSRLATWIYRIAVNRAVDAARGAKRWRFLPLLAEPGVLDRPASCDDEPQAVFERGAHRAAIQAVMMKCAITHREVLSLRYYRDLSVEEVADTLGCSVSAAKVRLHRARHAFKAQYLAAEQQDVSPERREEGNDAAKPTR